MRASTNDLRDKLLALYGSVQPNIHRRIRPFHDGEDRVGHARRVIVRILLPSADDLELKELRADRVQQDVAVGSGLGIEG